MYMAGDFDALVVDSAGCGAHLKDFYPELKGRVKDLTEWLVEVGLPEPKREVKVRVSYQDACHLAHAQRIRKPPRDFDSGRAWSRAGRDAACGYLLTGRRGSMHLEPAMSTGSFRRMDDLLGNRADSRHGPNQVARRLADALRVCQVAGVLVAHAHLHLALRLGQPDLDEPLRQVLHTPLQLGIEILEVGAASGGVDDEGVKVAGHVHASVGISNRSAKSRSPFVREQRTAAALIRWEPDFAAASCRSPHRRLM